MEFAEKSGITVLPKHIFADRGERGCKTRRAGFKQLQQAVASGEVDVVLIMTTSRLFRKTYRSLQFVEEEIVERGIRCVFVEPGIDTADTTAWQMQLQMHAMIDEYGVRMNVAHIQAAHRGLLRNGVVHTTITFGYMGEPIEGTQTRRGMPRRRFAVDPETGPWVIRVFCWFVHDGLSIGQIVRKLNALGAPPPPKSTTGRWTHGAVVYLLKNLRYRGQWDYGATEAVWLSKKDYSRQFPREEPLETVHIEALRLVSDADWYKAQDLLANNRHRRGRAASNGDARKPTLLDGLLRCEAHDHPLYTGGSYGRYYYCPVCKRTDKPALYSMLPRALAARMVCERLADAIRQDEALVESIAAYYREEVNRAQQPDPERIDQLNRRLERLDGKIRFVLDAGGETDEDRGENMGRLRAFRAERAGLRAELAILTESSRRDVRIPSHAEVRETLSNLENVLLAARDQPNGQQAAMARRVVEMITGGVIRVDQAGERRPQRGWVRGTFHCHLLAAVVSQTGLAPTTAVGDAIEVSIDFREPTRAEQIAEQVTALHDQGVPVKEIAGRLDCDRNLVTKAPRIWFERRGRRPPDGRSRTRPRGE